MVNPYEACREAQPVVHQSPSFVLSPALLLCMSVGFMILSFRYLSLPLLVSAVIASAIQSRRSHALAWTLSLLFCVASFSPIDVFSLRMPCGKPKPGVRLVRVVIGLPAHTSCVERYGEYVAFGCSASPFSPMWVVVWH